MKRSGVRPCSPRTGSGISGSTAVECPQPDHVRAARSSLIREVESSQMLCASRDVLRQELHAHVQIFRACIRELAALVDSAAADSEFDPVDRRIRAARLACATIRNALEHPKQNMSAEAMDYPSLCHLTIGAFRERSTELLTGFLKAEIDIGFTFCETARIEGQLMKDAEGYRMARQNAVKAAETVRHFEQRIPEAERERFAPRIDELEKLIARLDERRD